MWLNGWEPWMEAMQQNISFGMPPSAQGQNEIAPRARPPLPAQGTEREGGTSRLDAGPEKWLGFLS